ncbi:MAG: hypothetical protein MZV65_42230 [Chromatiales bacterium]|nr:hypothetical protein [Chromatiales bacterium]
MPSARQRPGLRRPDDPDRQGLLAPRSGMEVASLGVQVHGGMGYIEETGAAQYLPRRAHHHDLRRHDRRSRPTTSSAARPLRDGGATVAAFVSDMRAVDAPLANAGEELAVVRQALARALDELVQCSTHLLTGERRDPELVERGCVRLHDADRHGHRRLATARAARSVAVDQLAAGGDKTFLRYPGRAGAVLCRARAAALHRARRGGARRQRLDDGAGRRPLLDRWPWRSRCSTSRRPGSQRARRRVAFDRRVCRARAGGAAATGSRSRGC